MKVSDYIATTTDWLPQGHVFTYTDFNTPVKKKLKPLSDHQYIEWKQIWFLENIDLK